MLIVPLTTEAHLVVDGIAKEFLPDASNWTLWAESTILCAGPWLARRVTKLIRLLDEIPKEQDFEWNVYKFTRSMNLSPRHEGDWLVVIPLTGGATLSTGGKLYKGFAAVVDDRWDFSPDVPMIFLRPKILVPSPIPPRREWISTQLSEKERNLREEIKALLPQAGTLWDRNTHEISYSSDELTKKLCELGGSIVQETVLTPLLSTFWNYWANQMTDCKQKLTWTVGRFPVPKRVINERSWMIIIPLYENTTLTPRGRLEDDSYTWIPDEPVMPADIPVIFCR